MRRTCAVDLLTTILVLIAGVVGFYAAGYRVPLLALVADWINRRLPVPPQRFPCPTPDPPTCLGVRS
jgi:hypothetical protein